MKFPKELFLDDVNFENIEDESYTNIKDYLQSLDKADVEPDNDNPIILAKYQLVETYKVKSVEPATRYSVEKIILKRK